MRREHARLAESEPLMADGSTIEWLNRPGTKPATWNPVRGCTRVSEGCVNCYAEVMAARFSDPGQWGHGFAETVRKPGGGAVRRWTGKVALIEEMLTEPLRWRNPRTIFANSTSDLFHEKLPDEAIDRIFAVMALCPQHTFLILTKRPERMRAYMVPDRPVRWFEIVDDEMALAHEWPHDGLVRDMRFLPNVWLGVSAEDQATADERISLLLETPAAVRFVSAEPLLGPIDLGNLYHAETMTDALDGMSETPVYPRGEGYVAIDPTYKHHAKLDWIIVGGESGRNARPMHPDWARSIRDQCQAAGVAFFFKQWGEWARWEPRFPAVDVVYLDDEGGQHNNPASAGAGGDPMVKVGKKKAGRLLDSREWNEFPEVRAP